MKKLLSIWKCPWMLKILNGTTNWIPIRKLYFQECRCNCIRRAASQLRWHKCAHTRKLFNCVRPNGIKAAGQQEGWSIVWFRTRCCSSWVSKAPFLTANSCQALVILVTMAALALQLPTVVDEFTCTCLALYSVKWNVSFENTVCLTWETERLSSLRRSSVQTLSG